MYSRGLAVLTFPFNLCANVALLSLKAAAQHQSDDLLSADVNATTKEDDVEGIIVLLAKETWKLSARMD